MLKLVPDEQRTVSDYVHQICGVALDASKGYLIEGRLGTLAREHGCSSFTQFIAKARVDSSGAIDRHIIDAITTNETLFFRDTAPFNLLRHKLVPELIDRRSRAGSKLPIRIWSAACSTGQELYSVAILLNDLLGDPSRHNFRLFGTDISDDAVARASRGIYTPVEISRGLDDNLRGKYFRAVPGGWQIRDELRALASFRTLNLLGDLSTVGKFDIIFCRNVAIYFSDRDRARLFQNLERALVPSGYLLIGAMESLNGISTQFESKRHLQCIFYQSKSLT